MSSSSQEAAVMTQILLDASSVSKLTCVTQPVELCDPAGRVLGQFVPKIDASEWERVGPEPSEEELTQREQSQEWYTTDEVLAHLRSLENG
jgi:hypothetical protein